MTDTQRLELEFYQGSAVLDVLKRFRFSDKERKLIEDAIRTSKMANPRMKLIQEVDTLLKEVAKTREPIQLEVLDNEETAKAIAKVSAPMPKKRILPFSMYWFLPLLTIFIMASKEYRFDFTYSFEDAQSYCKEQNQVLPLTMTEAVEAGCNLKPGTMLWSKDGFLLTWSYNKEDNDGQKHHVFCVDANNTKN